MFLAASAREAIPTMTGYAHRRRSASAADGTRRAAVVDRRSCEAASPIRIPQGDIDARRCRAPLFAGADWVLRQVRCQQLPVNPDAVRSRHLAPRRFRHQILRTRSSVTSGGARLGKQDEDVEQPATECGYGCRHIGPGRRPQNLLNSGYLLLAPNNTLPNQ
jgi:hypothetical protein